MKAVAPFQFRVKVNIQAGFQDDSCTVGFALCQVSAIKMLQKPPTPDQRGPVHWLQLAEGWKPNRELAASATCVYKSLYKLKKLECYGSKGVKQLQIFSVKTSFKK